MIDIPTTEELVAFAEQGTFVSKMARRFGLRNPAQIKQITLQCADLHNRGTVDLFEIVESSSFQNLSDSDFFTAMHLLCDILRELEATPAQVMKCTEALVARGGNDLMANEPNRALRDWCGRKPERASEIIAMARGGDSLSSRNLTFALEATSALNTAREIALAYDDTRRLSAITALGRIPDNDPPSRAKTIAVLKTLLDTGGDDTLRAHILHVVGSALVSKVEDYQTDAVALVGKLVEGAGDATIHQAANILSSYGDVLQPEVLAYLLKALLQVNTENKGTVLQLDVGLQILLEAGHDEAAISYVTQLFSKNEKFQLKELPSFRSSLFAGPPERLSRVIVQWLLRGTPGLRGGLAAAMQSAKLEGAPVELFPQDLSLSKTEQIFICRKAIGWLFFKPITAASILVSVLRVCDDETAQTLQNLMNETLLLNYGGVQKYLLSLQPDDTAKDRVDQCLANHDIYLSALQSVPQLKELEPSEHQRRIEQLRVMDEMRDAHKQARRQSVFLSVIRRSVLLYGDHSISFIKDGNDTLRPMEMDLKPHGISFEVPGMEIVDPVGLQYTLRIFRAERMLS
ncbi:hypothetical protein GEOBRER4_n2072 [Citrifermentans bremense]|uniref:Uncharacterized protein n=1 Tax=Citrifermentans bremense TaxID=60035 RepID=A0A6S6M757_9BACT|nr:hypothetical protein [Citrifermentans bremense]BCG47245.1 hypothetical protein GEOBRER4_n2072 [Citrifermentans bremense]